MKTTLFCAAIVALGMVSIGQVRIAQAQNAPATNQQSGTRVAVIDISKVFKEHPRFNQQMEAMKAEVKQFEDKLREAGKQIQALQPQLKQFEPGSAEYKKVEEQILQLQANGQIQATQKKNDFLEREAKIYFSVYNEIVNEVSQFANQNGIAIVVRFNSEGIDPSNRQSVLEGINRAVVYQNKSNITNAIIERLIRKNQGAAASSAALPQRQPAARQ